MADLVHVRSELASTDHGQDPRLFFRRVLAAVVEGAVIDPSFDPEAYLKRWAVGIAPGRKASSVPVYRSHWRSFARWCGVDQHEAVIAFILGGEAVVAQVVSYHLATMTGGKATQAFRTTVLRAMAEFAKFERRIDWVFGPEIRRPKVRKYRNVAGPGVEVASAMLAWVAAGNSTCKTRDYAILLLLIVVGLRRSEVVGLDVEHVDLAGCRIEVDLKGSGAEGERVWIPIPDVVAEAIAAWMADPLGPDRGPLFYGIHKGRQAPRLATDSVWRLTKKAAEGVGANPRTVAPHKLRHTAFTTAAGVAGDAFDLIAFTNHESIATAQIYLDGLRDVGTARRIGAAVAAIMLGTDTSEDQ